MPYALILVVVGRIIVALLNQNQEEAARAAPDPYATNWTWVVSVWVSLPFVVFGGAMITLTGAVWALVPALLSLVVLLPWAVARWLLVPLGRPRLAYWVVSRLSHVVWGYDRFQGGVVAGAWAALQRGGADLDRLEHALPGHHVSVTPGAALGAGLIAAARGDLPGARLLIASVQAFEPRVTRPIVRRLAREWLAVDAAATGDWARAVALAEAEGSKTATVALLGAVGRRRLGRPGSAGWLWLMWALSPGRRGALPVVRATAEAAPPPPRAEAPPLAEEGDPLARALALHATLLGRARPTREEVVRVAGAWDLALGDERLGARITARAEVLGARRGASAHARLTEEVQADLVALARAAGVALADLPGQTVSGAAGRLREDLLGELEGLGEAIGRRVAAGRALPPLDELREWLAVREAWERAGKQGGPEVRRLAFRSVHDPVTGLAVWLFNERGQRMLANVLFRWLLAEATAIGDARAVELQAKNVSCGY